MKLATTLLLFTLLGLSFASPSDSTSNLRRKLVDAESSGALAQGGKALDVAIATGATGSKEADPWDEPDTEEGGENNGNKGTVLPIEPAGTGGNKALAVPTGEPGVKEANPWDEPDTEGGDNNNKAADVGAAVAIPTGDGQKQQVASQEMDKHGGGNGRGRGGYDDPNDDGWRRGGDRRFDRCVRYCQQRCYWNQRTRSCPNKCYGWCHRQLGW